MNTIFRNISFAFMITSLAYVKGFAQTDDSKLYNIKNILSSSPEAAMLGRYGQIPVGSYTGTADISIPLYTLKEDGLEIPIVLRYHSSGNKVEDQATSVGLGWMLEPQYSITQVINGIEDHIDFNFPQWSGYATLKSTTPLGVYSGRQLLGPLPWGGCTTGSYPNQPADSLPVVGNMEHGRGQPDIYNYVLPGGYSGSFFLNPETNLPVLLDKSDDIKFEGWPYNWKATTLDGNQFFFDVYESANDGQVTPTSMRSYTFRMTKAVTATGKEINFNYKDGYYTCAYRVEEYHTPYLQVTSPSPNLTKQTNNSTNNTKYLTTITGNEVKIVFNYEDRTDMFGTTDNDGDASNGTLSTKRIKGIDILRVSDNHKFKTYQFAYDYFPYTATTGGSYDNQNGGNSQDFLDKSGKRLKLLSLQETGYTESNSAVNNPLYQFTYDESVTMPLKTSYARDFWGYYNGKSNTTLLPDLSFYYYSGYPEYANMPSNDINAYSGADKTVNAATAGAYMLSKVTYPTGGHTEFTYEPHDFSNYDYPIQSVINGAKKNISLQDWNNPSNDHKTITFTIPRSQVVRFTNAITDNQHEYSFGQLQPSIIKLEKISASNVVTTLKTWQMQYASNYSDSINTYHNYVFVDDVSITYEAGAQYRVTCDLPDNLGTQVNYGQHAGVYSVFTYYDTPPGGFKTSIGGGMRVKEVRDYTDATTLAKRTAYKYVNDNGTSSGILMTPIKYLTKRHMYYYEQLGSTGAESEGDVYYIGGESSMAYSDGAQGCAVGYSRVEELEMHTDNTSNGKRVVYYNNTESPNHPDVPGFPNYLNGKIRQERIYDNSAMLLKQTTYSYSDHQVIYFNGFKLMPSFIGTDACQSLNILCATVAINGSPCGELSVSYFDTYINKKYTLLSYPINSQWFLLDSKVTLDHGVSNTENYTYNLKGQLTHLASTNSKGQALDHVFTYPFDVTPVVAGSISEQLKANNRFSSLLQEKKILAGNELSNVVYNFQSLGGTLFGLSNIQRSFSGNPLTTEFEFTKYGGNEKVQEFNKLGANTALIWSNNNLHVTAQIFNAHNNQCAYTSFEDYEGILNSNWIYSTTSTATTAITGKAIYSLANGSIISHNSVLGNYIVTYWLKDGSGTSTVNGTSGTTIASANGWSLVKHNLSISGTASTITVAGSGYIDELRLYPLGAQMTSYTYNTLIGLSTVCDPKNELVNFQYDAFGRLINQKDQNGNILKHMDYGIQAAN